MKTALHIFLWVIGSIATLAVIGRACVLIETKRNKSKSRSYSEGDLGDIYKK